MNENADLVETCKPEKIVGFGWRYWIAGSIPWLVFRLPLIIQLCVGPWAAALETCGGPDAMCAPVLAVVETWLVILIVPVCAILFSLPGASVTRHFMIKSNYPFILRWLAVWLSAGLSAFLPFTTLIAFSSDRDRWGQVGWLLLVAGVSGLLSGAVYATLRYAEGVCFRSRIMA